MLRLRHLLTGLSASLMLLPLLCQAQGSAPTRNVTTTSQAQLSAPEQQLAAIRQALLDATLEAPTQVISTSWIDNMGALREEHQFNSKAEVRGVRLFSLNNDAQAETPPKASADVLPWGWRQDPQSSNSCAPAPRTWRLPLRISAGMATGFPGPQFAAGEALLRSIERQAHAQVRQGARWTPTESPVRLANTYMQSLAAPAREDNGGWELHIQLVPDTFRPAAAASQPVATETPASSFWGPAPWVWTLQLNLHKPSSGTGPNTRWEQTYRIAVDVEKVAEHPSRWRAPIEAELSQRIGVWLQGVETRLRCEPTPFVVRQDAEGLRLLAGQGSGLRVGDRVLIMQPGWVPGRLLDPRVADHMALAEVTRTGPRHADIRQLAGPPVQSGNDWVALPL